MSFEDIVREKEKQMINENFAHLRNNLETTEYAEKIDNYCRKFSFNKEEIISQIKENDIVASFFIKDPKKQNFTEKLVAELLGTKTMPQSGKNSVRFLPNGDICSSRLPDTSKSVDFVYNNMYITQKYTRGNGGAQDNQYNDVVDFLIKGSQQHKVGCIVDGDFWDKKRLELKEYFKDNKNVQILSMEEILNDQ